MTQFNTHVGIGEIAGSSIGSERPPQASLYELESVSSWDILFPSLNIINTVDLRWRNAYKDFSNIVLKYFTSSANSQAFPVLAATEEATLSWKAASVMFTFSYVSVNTETQESLTLHWESVRRLI